MKSFLFILGLALLLIFLFSEAQAQISSTPTRKVLAPVDGKSLANAILIHAKNEEEGMEAEYGWLKAHYSGYKLKRQSLINGKKRIYDKMEIITREGKSVVLYFDITEYFGKL
jgi:hypothetical protein